jgi:catechol 2,3-dioxygenase-like lactoylglutathione lyase family enzyme
MIEAKRFSHVTFETSDLERQIAYFTEVAGLALAEGVGFEPEALAQRARSFRSSLCRTTNARSGINRGFDIPSHFPLMRQPAHEREVAEGVGFEPTIRFPVYTLSKRAPSATRPPLRARDASAI